jgi:hypothetical protein
LTLPFIKEGENMKNLIRIANGLIYLLAGFFVLMSFDAFEEGNTFWVNLGGFLIHLLPAVIVFSVNFFLRKKHLILGVLLLGLAIFAFFFFKFYRDFPLIYSGTIHIIAFKQNIS